MRLGLACLQDLTISLIEIVRYANKQWDAWHGYMDTQYLLQLQK